MLRLATPLLVALTVVLAAFSVRLSGTPVLPETPYNYADIDLPRHLTAPVVANRQQDFADNPITDAGATLGRVLFYDTRLSLTETTSCASCHRQEAGFSDPNRFSPGHDGGETARHSMSLAFSRYYTPGAYFWDERAATLEEQVLLPIQDAVEMGMTLDAVTERLEATAFYPDLFEEAFGTPEVTSDRMARAMAQFIRSIVSPNSPYDEARAQAPAGPPGQPLDGLTAQQNRGLQLFFGPALCGQCHESELMVAPEARNNGLDATITDEGAGNGRFKVGSLRNVSLTAPYMHDGRFETLDEVVEHYSTGVRANPGLDPRLRRPNGQPRLLNLSPQQTQDLVAFMETLTDPTLADDERWSDPFAGSTAVEDESALSVGLGVAGANPFRGTTSLSLRLRTAGTAQLEAFDLTGRRVAVLHDGALAAGEHIVRWDAADLPAGLYVLRLTAGGGARTRTMTVVR